MGISKLMDFIKKMAPKSYDIIRPANIQSKTIVIDAANTIYQFLIKTQSMSLNNEQTPKILSDSFGNQTGHLIGILFRALMCLQYNIKPIWVFDGPPPKQKIDQLQRRKKLKQQAQQKMEELLESENLEKGVSLGQYLLKYSQRSVYVKKQQKQDAMQLLRLLGMPVIEAKSQSESQCAYLSKLGVAYGVISQDMDTLAFGAENLIRGFNKKNLQNIIDDNLLYQTYLISLKKILLELQFDEDQFIDFCILCGCDYTSKIEKIGPVNAYKYIKQFKNIDNLLIQIAQNKKLRARHTIPENFNHLRARNLFKNPQIATASQLIQQHITRYSIKPSTILDQASQLKYLKQKVLVQSQFNEQGLKDFLRSKQFNMERINNWITRARKSLNKVK